MADLINLYTQKLMDDITECVVHYVKTFVKLNTNSYNATERDIIHTANYIEHVLENNHPLFSIEHTSWKYSKETFSPHVIIMDIHSEAYQKIKFNMIIFIGSNKNKEGFVDGANQLLL
jgi:hypothetical protein